MPFVRYRVFLFTNKVNVVLNPSKRSKLVYDYECECGECDDTIDNIQKARTKLHVCTMMPKGELRNHDPEVSRARSGLDGEPSSDDTDESDPDPDGVSSGDVLGEVHWIASTSFSFSMAACRATLARLSAGSVGISAGGLVASSASWKLRSASAKSCIQGWSMSSVAVGRWAGSMVRH